jgi:hypothetical protein
MIAIIKSIKEWLTGEEEELPPDVSRRYFILGTGAAAGAAIVAPYLPVRSAPLATVRADDPQTINLYTGPLVNGRIPLDQPRVLARFDSTEDLPNVDIVVLQLEKIRKHLPLLYERSDVLFDRVMRGSAPVSARTMRFPISGA